MKQFGKDPSLQYVDRHATYAVVHNGEKIATVIGRNDVLFLPGGGIESHENAESALVREIFEECGRRSKILSFICEAVQYFEVPRENINHRCFMTFYLCEFTSSQMATPEHDIYWLSKNDKKYAFAHPSHRWVFDKYA